MTPLTIAIILVMLLCGAAFGAFFAVLRRPPVVHVDLGDIRIDVVGTLDATQAFPSSVSFRVQQVPPDAPSPGEAIAPIPVAVLAYIDEESDEWARQARRTRARTLFMETGNWEYVLSALKREDGVVEDTKNG